MWLELYFAAGLEGIQLSAQHIGAKRRRWRYDILFDRLKDEKTKNFSSENT
jgi:hypothetical protein